MKTKSEFERFETDCHTVVDRSDINLKGLRYEVLPDGHDDGQRSLYIRESRETMKELLGVLYEWAYDGSDSVMFCEDDFEQSEFNPFDRELVSK